MQKNVLLANNEWIEVTPSVTVSGPLHKIYLEGVVSSQPEKDVEDIRIEDDGDNPKKIFVRRSNDKDEDRVFTMTYRVNAHGADYFTNTKVIVRKSKS